MPKVLFLDTKPHIYDVLKRKFEREGFEVLAEGQDQDVDLIVKGKSSVGGAIGHGDARSHIPMIILSEDHIADKENMASVAHLKMPFRPSQLMVMARQAVMGVI